MNFEDELHILFLLSVAGVSSMLCACVCTYIGFTHLSFSQHDITTRNFSAIYQHNSLFFAECAKFPSIDSHSLFSAFTKLDSTLVLLPNGRNVETWILNTHRHTHTLTWCTSNTQVYMLWNHQHLSRNKNAISLYSHLFNLSGGGPTLWNYMHTHSHTPKSVQHEASEWSSER